MDVQHKPFGHLCSLHIEIPIIASHLRTVHRFYTSAAGSAMYSPVLAPFTPMGFTPSGQAFRSLRR